MIKFKTRREAEQWICDEQRGKGRVYRAHRGYGVELTFAEMVEVTMWKVCREIADEIRAKNPWLRV